MGDADINSCSWCGRQEGEVLFMSKFLCPQLTPKVSWMILTLGSCDFWLYTPRDEATLVAGLLIDASLTSELR
jgi:hypothetical protein